MAKVADKKSTKKKNEEVVAKTSVVKNALADAFYKKWGHMFSKIPDRTENLFRTGIPSLDATLGGGLPRGQMIHIYGNEGAGKSTLAQQIAASALKQGERYLYIDPENTMHSIYGNQLGLDVNDPRCYVGKDGNDNAETTLDFLEEAIRNDLYNIIIIDTVAAFCSMKTKERSNEEDEIGVKARMITKALEKLNNAIVHHDVILIWVNQLRANISKGPQARNYTTPGGKALPFYCNVAMHIARSGSIKEGASEDATTIGQTVMVRIDKNKIAAPMRRCELSLIYGEGFRRDMDLIKTAIEEGIIKVSGSWYSMGEISLGQGIKGTLDYASKNPGFLDELEKQVYANNDSESGSTSNSDEVAKAAKSE
jgi:recombination protein RecA